MNIAAGHIARHAGVLLGILLFIYVATCVLLFLAQRSMLYYPQRGAPATLDSLCHLVVPGAKLQIACRARAGPKALIYFGGNAEDVSLSLPGFSAAFPDRALFLLHYRGYGGSSGKPTESALQSDALALFDHVRLSYADIAVVGRSLGSGVAIRVAALRPASSLVLITPYDSIQELAAAKFPYLPINWLLIDKYQSWRYAPSVKAPTLLLAAANDEVIPFASTEKLYHAFPPGVASLKIIPYFGHNDISTSAVYLEDIRAAVAAGG